MGKDYVLVNHLNDDVRGIVDSNIEIIEKLTKATFVSYIDTSLTKVEIATSYGLLLAGYRGNDNIDIDALNKEIDSLTMSIERRRKLLSNEGYVNKAPKNLVDGERAKLDEEIKKLEILKNKLN